MESTTDSRDIAPNWKEIKRIPAFQPLKLNQLRFIRALLACNLIVEKAAVRAKVEWRNHYRWMKQEAYKQAVEYAKEILADSLESTMLDHAIAGRETPIVYKGEVTGYIREVNASERIVLLKGMRPQYRENFQINQLVGPVQVAIVYPKANDVLSAKTDKESGT